MASAGTGVAIYGGATAAAATDPYQPQPSTVRLEYDEAVLKKYRPKLVIEHLDIKPNFLAGWVARSNDRDTHVACYWAYYVAQSGGGVNSAEHADDREPVQVHYDPDTGEVQQVIVDGYHYYAARYPEPTLVEDTRPLLYVQKPYHFYVDQGQRSGGKDVDLEDMHDWYPGWIRNGWLVSKKAALVPWEMFTRTHYWSEESMWAGLTAFQYSVKLSAGLAGADSADTDALATDGAF